MKAKVGLKKAAAALGLVLGLVLCFRGQIIAQAAEVVATVNGTILAETKTGLLYLSTSDGVMEIKIDSDTDVSECKALLAERKISVSLSYGSDGYMHAVKISSEVYYEDVDVDQSATAVYGTLSKQSKGDLLIFKTQDGTMEIKLDPSTDMTNCTILVPESNYTILCARGSDAYLHAVSIANGISNVSMARLAASSSLTPAPQNPSNVRVPTAAVVGTVASGTTENILHLSTNEGEMEIVIDADTDTRNGVVLVPGNLVVVSLCRGSDAYLHAIMVAGVKTVSNIVIDTTAGSQTKVSGTIAEKSTEDILRLDTSSGTMELKMDAVERIAGCKALTVGKKVTLICTRGSDAYMHAIEIAA